MILVFGGTTEGRKAVEVLEEAGTPYYYSTKTGEQDIALHHGQRIDGALDAEAMTLFCREHGIRLLVDAAHPFAAQLHETVTAVASSLGIAAIRYERIFPPRDADITWIDGYDQIPHDFHSLLATTGVQSITRLKLLEAAGIKVYYRILNRASSVALALRQGAGMNQLCYYDDPKDIPVEAEAILLKESGITGGFKEKVEAAKARGMRIIALRRPATPDAFTIVNGPYGLRRTVEHLLPDFYPLRSGLTTGTCATAAAIAATRQLLYGETPAEVPVLLPDGETISVPVGYADGYAYCIKEAGDDPDVTNGVEIRASVGRGTRCFERGTRCEVRGARIVILGGEGVGTFTLPGFDYPPGSPAINKGPREMIRQNLALLTAPLSREEGLEVLLSVPNGEEIARRTFNPRLGIEGGISIIGVSGIVKPFSEKAFVDSIRKCMQVAKASGTSRVVLNSGAKSERYLKELYPTLPQQAFVQYGNFIGDTLLMADELDFQDVTLGVMLGKAVKLAEGQMDTHSRKGTMNMDFIRQMLSEAQCDADVSGITLARELWDRIPQDQLQDFVRVVISHCSHYCSPLLKRSALTVLLIDDEGHIYE